MSTLTQHDLTLVQIETLIDSLTNYIESSDSSYSSVCDRQVINIMNSVHNLVRYANAIDSRMNKD